MPEPRERRLVPRTLLAESVPAWIRGIPRVRLLDLSLKGARIAHLDLLRPGAACELELPVALRSLVLAAEVVWCRVIGQERGVRRERHLQSHSGLRFHALTDYQRIVLAGLLRQLPPETAPALDSERRSA